MDECFNVGMIAKRIQSFVLLHVEFRLYPYLSNTCIRMVE